MWSTGRNRAVLVEIGVAGLRNQRCRLQYALGSKSCALRNALILNRIRSGEPLSLPATRPRRNGWFHHQPLIRLVKKLRQIPPGVRLGTGHNLLRRSLDDDLSSAFAALRA